MNELIWLNQEDFVYQINNSLHEKIQEYVFCAFEIKPQILKRLIPIEADDYVAPFTEPGHCLKWYGIFGGVYFQITSYIGHSNLGQIILFSKNLNIIDWQILNDEKFPQSFIKKLTWMGGDNDALTSLFCVDEEGLTYEFYRATSRIDSENLKDFLARNKFLKEVFIGDAETLSLTWIVETAGKVVARYTSRYACEQYAVRTSKENDLFYFVSCESLPNNGKAVVWKGKIIK